MPMNRMLKKSYTIWKFLQEEGVRESLLRLGKTVLSPLYKSESMFFYEKDLFSIPRVIQPKLAVCFRFATNEDSKDLENSMYHAYSELLLRFVKKNKCFIGSIENEIVFYAWISILKAYIPEIDTYINLTNNEAYIYNVRTLKKYRRNGIAAYAYHKILGYCKDSGFTKALISVCGNNISSVKSIEKAGFKRTKEIKYTRILGFKTYSEKITS